MRVAMRLQEGLAAPFTANGVDVFTSASIGIALSSPAFQNPADMLRDADIAMCRAKTQGTSGCEVFDTQMHAMVVRRLTLKPNCAKPSSATSCAFCISRSCDSPPDKSPAWRRCCVGGATNPNLVGPADFIEVAEETGLIVPIGRWILKEAVPAGPPWHVLIAIGFADDRRDQCFRRGSSRKAIWSPT